LVELEDREPKASGSRGRGRLAAAPRSERKSLEVFGGAPASTRYLPGAGAAFGAKSVPEGEEEPIEPPWAAPIVAPKPNPAGTSQSGTPLWSAPRPKPSSSLDIPEYKPKPVIGSDDPKPVIRHQRSSSDGLTSAAPLQDPADERRAAIDKLKRLAEEDAKRNTAKRLTNDGSKSPDKQAMPEHVMAGRAAAWGLVLKSDPNSGKTQGVQTRKSGENRRSSDRR
jgi:hypothetical protein